MEPLPSIQRSIDTGQPFILPLDESGARWALDATVCASPTCSGKTLHLVPFRVVDAGRITSLAERAADLPRLAYCVATRELSAETASSAVPPAFAAFVAGAHERLELRFQRLAGQREPRHAFRYRPPPAWKPPSMLAHADFFPYDFEPVLVADRDAWVVTDQHCADPACGCGGSALQFLGADEHHAIGALGSREVAPGSKRARALWEAVNRDEQLLDTLRRRRRETRAASAWAVAAAYEADRRARAPSRPPAPPGLVALWDAAGALVRSRPWHAVPTWMELRTRVTGATSFDGWIGVDDDDGDEPLMWARRVGHDNAELVLYFPRREDAPARLCRERLSAGLPLLDGDRLALAEREPPDDDSADAGAILEPRNEEATDAEAELLGVLARALAGVTGEVIELADRVLLADERVSPTTFERVVPTAGGDARVELVAADPEADWEPMGAPAGGDRDEGEDDDESGEHGRERGGEDGGESAAASDDEHADDDGAEAGEDDGDLDGDELDTYTEDGGTGEELLHEDDEDCGVAEDEPSPADGVEFEIAAIADRMRDRGIEEPIVLAMATLIRRLSEAATDPDHAPQRWRDVVPAFLASPNRRALCAADGLEVETALSGLRAAVEWLGEVGHSSAAEADALVSRIDSLVRHDQPVARAPRTRWRPLGGEAAPPPSSACPCGSGRRYKKCCMSR